MPAAALQEASDPRLFRCLCHSSAFKSFCRRLDDGLSRRGFLASSAAASASAMLPKAAQAQAQAQAPAPAAPIAFINVQVFDGTSASLRSGLTVVVEGNKIKSVRPAGTSLDTGTKLIDGGGRTLMPGLIDAHTHLMFAAVPQALLLTADIGFVNIAAGKEATNTLMRGFTSVRDMGGPIFGLKRAIDSGLVPGPRIWPSGAFVSQSGGHGDFRLPTDIPARPDDYGYAERIGASAIADDPDTVRKRVREQLAIGASQIKLMAGGGVSSNMDPLDVTQYSVPELRAAVEAAENWGTYVAVHAYTPRAVRQCLEAGVKSIEHGQLLDEATVKLMAEKGVCWSLQPFLDDEDATPFPAGSLNRAKQLQMIQGTDNAYMLAKKYKLKTAWGTDTLFDAKLATRQGAQLAKLVRWYSAAETLKMATSTNGEVLAMSGLRSPYPGKLGVIEEGAYADILLVDGDPIANIHLLAEPERNLLLVMKDGVVYKNRLS